MRSRYTVAVSGTAILDQRFSYRDDGSIGQVAAVTATLTSTGSIKSTGVYTDTFVYTQDGEPLEFVRQQNGQTKRYWYVLDGRNNVVAVTDSSGTVVDRYAYDLWGEPLPGLTAQQVPQQLRYGGYWQDDAVGWNWATTRYYDPELMRWMQPDASKLASVHTYAYVGDDPIDLTDPLGLLTCSGSHDVLSWLGNAACNAGNFAGDVAQGVWGGAVETAQGLGSIAHGAWNSTIAWIYDPRAAQAQWAANGQLAYFITHQPKAFGEGLIIAVVSPYQQAIRTGHWGRAVGRGGFDAITFLVGPKGLNKLADLARGSSTEQVLTGLARQAARTVPRNGKSAAVWGTPVHSEFERLVVALNRNDLDTEVRYLNGILQRGARVRGEVRLDVVVYDRATGRITQVFDLKTGAQGLTPARVAQIRAHLPVGSQGAAIIEIRPS